MAAAALAIAAGPARADDGGRADALPSVVALPGDALPSIRGTPSPPAEAPRPWALSFDLGWFRPDGDSAFSESDGAGRPFVARFGREHRFMPSLTLARDLFVTAAGTLSLSAGAGYSRASAPAVATDGMRESIDRTAMTLWPLSIAATWRFDRLPGLGSRFPIVPFMRTGVDGLIWRVTGAGQDDLGLTFGYHYGIGLELDLARFHPPGARTFYQDAGVERPFVNISYTRHHVTGFGDAAPLNLSGGAFTLGFGFRF